MKAVLACSGPEKWAEMIAVLLEMEGGQLENREFAFLKKLDGRGPSDLTEVEKGKLEKVWGRVFR